MNLHQHPDLIDRLASAHALGTLRGGARRRFEALARQHPAVRAASMAWQSRLGGLTELQPPHSPSPAVWTRIDNLVQAQRSPARPTPRADTPSPRVGWWQKLALWQTSTAFASLVAGVLLWQQGGLHQRIDTLTAQQSRIEYVAVLSQTGAGGSTSGAQVLVTFDAQRKHLTLQRVGNMTVSAHQSLQLWALPEGGKPRSLGVMGEAPLLQVAAGSDAMAAVPALAISLEPEGGVPSDLGPTGPVVFSGSLIRAQSL